MSLTDYTARYLPRIEDEMKDLLELEGALAGYYGMMQYHLGWIDGQMVPGQGAQGKRLRPVLCLLACEAVGAGSSKRYLLRRRSSWCTTSPSSTTTSKMEARHADIVKRSGSSGASRRRSMWVTACTRQPTSSSASFLSAACRCSER